MFDGHSSDFVFELLNLVLLSFGCLFGVFSSFVKFVDVVLGFDDFFS